MAKENNRTSTNVAIVGAGHAGGTAAGSLRQFGFTGTITLLGDEPIPPYQRPPLSKAWLKDEVDAESLALRPLKFYVDQLIEFRPNTTVVRIHRRDRFLELSDGSALDYETLILATGARPIELSIEGADLKGVMYLRTASDAQELKTALKPGKRLVVVGGGYVGLEVAATARALGVEVVVLEREPRLLARVACTTLSDFLRGYHESNGVKILVDCSVSAFIGSAGRISGVKLADGSILDCDTVVVGVGARPNDTLATDAGLNVAQGVVVDIDARTSDDNIFAIGDVARRPMPIYDRMFRMESVPNALEQARQAASAICGRPRPAGECPWQWSDQYDLKLQIAGYAFDADQILMRGDPAKAKFAIFHLKGCQIIAVDAINSPTEFMMGKQLILTRQSVNIARLADLAVSMKEVAN